MNRRHSAVKLLLWITVVTGVGAGTARPQVGQSEDEFGALYGEPVNAVEGTGGDVVLHYRTPEGAVEAGILDGRVNRVLYRKSPLTDADILAFLTRNAAGGDWRLQVPMLMPELHEREWIRSDGALLASLCGETVLVGSAEWHQNALRGQMGTNAVAKSSGAETQPHVRRVPEGIWTGKNTRGEPVGMAIQADGVSQWVVITRDGPREVALAVQVPSDAGGPITVRTGSVGTRADPVALGTLRTDADFLVFTSADTGGRVPRALWSMRVDDGVILQRDTALPQWTPPTLPGMPAVGATRAEVLQTLGKPRGVMGSGDQEVLIYSGGRIHLEQGRVKRVETK